MRTFRWCFHWPLSAAARAASSIFSGIAGEFVRCPPMIEAAVPEELGGVLPGEDRSRGEAVRIGPPAGVYRVVTPVLKGDGPDKVDLLSLSGFLTSR